MPVIRTAYSVLMHVIGVVSFAFATFVVFLMYTDPIGCGIFLNNVNDILTAVIQLVRHN